MFTPAIVRGPQDLPLATFTVLFRPLPTEAHSSLEKTRLARGDVPACC